MSALTLLAQAGEAPAGPIPEELIVFIVVGAVSLGSALAVVVLRNAVHAALMLVINFFTIAVFYAVLEAQFLGVVQIIVYAGAIMVLFLFVIMLLGVDRPDDPRGDRIAGQKPAAVILGLVLFAAMSVGVAAPYLSRDSACPSPAETDARPCAGLAEANGDNNVEAVGSLLFTRYVWPFEVTSVLLVIAALGAMVLGRKHEDPRDLVDMPEEVSEPGQEAAEPVAAVPAAAVVTAEPADPEYRAPEVVVTPEAGYGPADPFAPPASDEPGTLPPPATSDDVDRPPRPTERPDDPTEA